MASSKKRPASELPAQLDNFLLRAAVGRKRVLLGLSGGLDSCVLLHLLAALRARHGFDLSAVHVNHGISPHADEWQRFCASCCTAVDVPYSAVRVNVPRNSGLGIEAAAREARYRALLDRDTDFVALAHHRDDQAETLLLQLLRGAGIKGLAAMPAVGDAPDAVGGNSGVKMLRPLLDVPRTVLAEYAEAHGLRWIEDESNLDLAYDRNFLRHRVMPVLEERFPASRTTLSRSSAHFAEAADLLDEIGAEDAARLVHERRLDVAGMRALSLPRAKNLLRFWLSGHLSMAPNARRLEEVYRQLCEARQDAQLAIRLEGGQVRRYRGEAMFEADLATPISGLDWHGEPELRLPAGLLRFEKAEGSGLANDGRPLQIRYRHGGERFRPDGRRPTRSLRHLFQEAGIPPWARQTLPLVYRDDTLVAVPGIGVAWDSQAGPGEPGWLISWWPDVAG